MSDVDYSALLEETRCDLREVKIGLAQWLIVEVIFDYSFAQRQASAWLPSYDVFVVRTGMGKKEIGKVLAQLESYGVLESEPAPEVNWPHARRYKIFPRRTRAWSIAPRVPNLRLVARAGQMDRWLRALNASGGPAQGNLWPEQWDHADTLAEWQASAQFDSPDAKPNRAPASAGAAEPSSFQAGSAKANPAKPVGKYPARGEIPHTSLNGGYELNERELSSFNPLQPLNEPVGNLPTTSEDDDERPEHWPSREHENRLMRRLAELMSAFYAGDAGQTMMARYGGIWRWRIRQWPFPVEQAIAKAEAQWSEIKKLGGFLNREWSKIWRKRAELQQQQLEERIS